ncbi:unnamed protein product [Ostreobium quekettii]|uniref:Uncharacterized protein n=1 Tax=Ostreobium quekettii TaxID=121088 RepID=A0A8S1J0L2_9CHLO|nr:unnamed protein product [Ostreobium quekettii]
MPMAAMLSLTHIAVTSEFRLHALIANSQAANRRYNDCCPETQPKACWTGTDWGPIGTIQFTIRFPTKHLCGMAAVHIQSAIRGHMERKKLAAIAAAARTAQRQLTKSPRSPEASANRDGSDHSAQTPRRE